MVVSHPLSCEPTPLPVAVDCAEVPLLGKKKLGEKGFLMKAFLWMVAKIILDAAFGVYLTLGAAALEALRLRAAERLRATRKRLLLGRAARRESLTGEIPEDSLIDCWEAMNRLPSQLTWRQIWIVWRLK